MAVLTVRDTAKILNDVENMEVKEVEKSIQEEFPKLVLSAIRIHSHYLKNEPDTKKQKIAERILKLVADEKFWNALKALKLSGDTKKKKGDNKVEWGEPQSTGVGGE